MNPVAWSHLIFWTLVLAPIGLGIWFECRRREDARVEAFFAALRGQVDAAQVAETRRIEDHWARHGGLWPVQCAALLEGEMRCVGKASEDGLCCIHLTIREQGHTVRTRGVA